MAIALLFIVFALLLTLGVPAGAGQGHMRLDNLFQALHSTTDAACRPLRDSAAAT